MKYCIITGTSRGIGESLAKQLLDESHHLFCISRTVNHDLIKLSEKANNAITYFPFDLNKISEIDQLFEKMFSIIRQNPQVDAIYLINNAGMLSPVAPIERCSTASVIENVTINLLAPMTMTSHFIKHTQGMNVDKRIMNISSASAKYLMPSQSCYSTSKAGLDSFTKSINLEQTGNEYPVKIASVYPGMIDTQMQAEIRSANVENFPYVGQFIQIAQEGKLQTAAYTAGKLIDILSSDDFGSTAIIEEL